MYNKEEIEAQIWQNPDAAVGLHFDNYRSKWQSRQRMNGEETNRKDRLILERKNGSIFYAYNGEGESRPNGDIWQLLQYRYGTNDFAEVMEKAAAAYGIQPTFSGEDAERQRKAWQQRTTITNIANEAAGILTLALNDAKGAIARKYIESRGLKPSAHFGAFGAALRQELIDKLKKKYDEGDVRSAVNSLFPVLRKDYTKDVNGSYTDFADSYKVILPYYSGSRLYGFCLRLTADKTPTYTDENGKVREMPKYLYSIGKDKGGIMEKGGYCPEELDARNAVYLVEGLLDAEAIMQAGYSNVMALGGMTPSNSEGKANSSQILTLQRYGIRHIVYMPDIEANEDGTPKTKATEATIKALQPYLTAGMDGKGFVSLGITTFELPDVKDAADIYRLHGADTLLQCLNMTQEWWQWLTMQNMQQNADNLPEMADNFARLYQSICSPIEREVIRRQLTTAPIDSPLQQLKEAGITAESLLQCEREGELKTYRSRITEAIDSLKDAADKHADKDTMRRLIDNAAAIQKHSAAQSFMAQVNATADMLGAQIAQEGEYIDVPNWTLWNEDGKRVRKVSFAPASVSVFAAPSSHGKTLVMLQTALYLAQTRQEHVLYIGLENDAKQLYIRALSAYIGDAWQGLQVPNRRRAVRQYYKGQRIVGSDEQQGSFAAEAADTKAKDMIQQKAAEYEAKVRPFLHLVRVGNDCEALCDNIAMQVQEWQNNGEAVAAVFIDYVQLLHIVGRNYSRTDEMKNICDMINELAKQCGLPIIVGSQMNRAATKGEGGTTPALDSIDMYNLGESSGIENIAEDCYLIWDIDRTNLNKYQKNGITQDMANMLWRSRRIFAANENEVPALRKGHVYIESLKGREYATGCYCLIPADFAAGTLDMKNETKK